jgi:hypothetical protein
MTDISSTDAPPADSLKPDYSLERRELLPLVPPTTTRLLDVGCYSGAFGAMVKRHMAVEVWRADGSTGSSLVNSESSCSCRPPTST